MRNLRHITMQWCGESGFVLVRRKLTALSAMGNVISMNNMTWVLVFVLQVLELTASTDDLATT
jgi:hypothetical protein